MSFFHGTMWLLRSSLALLALSAGLCVALTSEQGEFPLPGLDLFPPMSEMRKPLFAVIDRNFGSTNQNPKFNMLSYLKDAECKCVSPAAAFSPQMRRDILCDTYLTNVTWMLVPISAGSAHVAAFYHFFLSSWAYNFESWSSSVCLS